MPKATDVALPPAELPAAVTTVFPAAAPVQQSLFSRFASGADTIPGHSLEKDKTYLVGLPFVITSITMRDGIRDRKTGNLQNYCSLELVVADAPTIADLVLRKRIDPARAKLIVPDEQLVINDGSTGICRQVVAYLSSVDLIGLPDGPDKGGMGETRWDTYRGLWTSGGGTQDEPEPRFLVKLLCPRGLRVSEYESDYNPDGGTTFYLA